MARGIGRNNSAILLRTHDKAFCANSRAGVAHIVDSWGGGVGEKSHSQLVGEKMDCGSVLSRQTQRREAGCTGNSSVWGISVCGRGEGEKIIFVTFPDESDTMFFWRQTWLEARDSNTKHCTVKLGSRAKVWCGLFQFAEGRKVKKHNITTFP